jgi:deoxyribodipyrimidine photo-lyase
MHALDATGWINFRMRALLVSFACYDLWLDWRPVGEHLARLFVDYEPGIHWSQIQMQAGTTGINVFRIYNPTRQAIDQDPSGEFIRHWVPELQDVSTAWIHQPWTMPGYSAGGSNLVTASGYQLPIVDHDSAARAAKTILYDVRNRPETQVQADEVRQKHGSRMRPPLPQQPRSRGRQLTLDLS